MEIIIPKPMPGALRSFFVYDEVTNFLKEVKEKWINPPITLTLGLVPAGYYEKEVGRYGYGVVRALAKKAEKPQLFPMIGILKLS